MSSGFHPKITLPTRITDTANTLIDNIHTRACYKNHRPATIMVISLSLRFVDQIGTSVRFWPKK